MRLPGGLRLGRLVAPWAIAVAAAAHTAGASSLESAPTDLAAVERAQRTLPFDARVRLQRAVLLAYAAGPADPAARDALAAGLDRRPRDPLGLSLAAQAAAAAREPALARALFARAAYVAPYDAEIAEKACAHLLDAAREAARERAEALAWAERSDGADDPEVARAHRADATARGADVVLDLETAVSIGASVEPEVPGWGAVQPLLAQARALLADERRGP